MKHISATATLAIGAYEATQLLALTYLQQTLCKHAGCEHCADCQMVRMRTHHHVLWITPEKKYTLDLLEPITQTIGFTLEPEEHLFFVLEKAELLTTACANSLLKIVEEPPTGYHFLFLATQAQLVLPTIRSRCQITYATSTQQKTVPHFLRHFMQHITQPGVFLKDLAESPEDHEVPNALDTLLDYWIRQSKEALTQHDQTSYTKAHAMISLLQKTMASLPMPGSAKLFWRNLYLQKEAIKNHENA